MGAGGAPLRAEHRMAAAAGPVVTLLVEADLDARFWRMWAHRGCRPRVPGGDRRGRAAVRAELAAALAQGLAFVAVVDADLDRLWGRTPAPGEVWTDAHDLEATLLRLPGLLQKVVRLHLPAGSAAAEALGDPGALFGAGAFPGRLRALAVLEDLDARALPFKKDGKRGHAERYARWDRCGAAGALTGALAVDPAKLLDDLVAWHSQQALKPRLPALRARVDATLPDADPAQLCNGHDLVGLLFAALKAAGSAVADADALTASLCLACERAALDRTGMAAGLRAWEAAHPGLRIFSDP
jgi:hypothetical protein